MKETRDKWQKRKWIQLIFFHPKKLFFIIHEFKLSRFFFYPSASSVLIVFHSGIFIPVEGHFNLDCHTSKVCA